MTRNRLIPLLLTFVCAASGLRAATVCNLKVEFEQTPLGIDAAQPRFSWQLKAAAQERGVRQTAYRIVVADETGQSVWDSGRRGSAQSANVSYAGKSLRPQTRYAWTVTSWTADGRQTEASSWFETGLMDSSIRAWHRAKWIGLPADRLPLYSQCLAVFRLGFTIQLDRESRSSQASFLFGANDPRLMSPYMNAYAVSSARDSSYISLELDTSPLDQGGETALNVRRKGYTPADTAAPVLLKRLTVPAGLINKTNRYSPLRFTVAVNLGVAEVCLETQESHSIGSVRLNPLGTGGDFAAWPVAADLGFQVSQGQKAALSAVEVRSFRSPANLIANVGELELKGVSDRLVTVNPSRGAQPMLRATFKASKPVAKARLYITARGVYDVYMNGCRVTEERLNPGFTQYNKTQLYQAYDVTRLLCQGENALGAVLGEGWWSGNMTYEGQNWNYFGDRQSLLAMLVITFDDGERRVLTSSPDTWRCYDGGPWVLGSLFQGEVYDARRCETVSGWTEGCFNDSAWMPASEVSTEGTTSRDGWGNGPAVADFSAMRLQGQYGPALRAVQELLAVSVKETCPGVYIYDMGQNFAGTPVIDFGHLRAGQRVTLRYAEVLYPPLPEYEEMKGMLMLENIRAAMATDVYIASGKGRERFAPRLTFHGYRYVEVSGTGAALPLECVRAEVISSIHELKAGYTASDSLLNRLWKNICWSARSNFFSVPTDCPQRNERLGWAGDISVFSPTATYIADAPQFLRRYLQAMRDVQHDDGRMPDIAPLGGGFGGFLWGSASITVPWECFRQYADTVMRREHYPAMKRYMDYVAAKYIDPRTGLIVQERQWGDLGDWLGLEDSRNDKPLLWECYYIYDLHLMSRMAEALGLHDDAARFARLRDERRRFFRAVFLDENGMTVASDFTPGRKGQPVDTQTSYALALATGAVDDEMRSKAAARLAETLRRSNRLDTGKTAPPYSLMTGFIGTAWISAALSDNGFTAEAYQLLLNTGYPSWLYPVTQGATTIWERLNSYTLKDGFGGNNRMNSFNHYSFGAVGSWLINHSLGIKRDERAAGFQRFTLQPEPDPTGKLTSAHGYYDSVYGRIESGWTRKEGGTEYRFTIPANTSATLLLPASSAKRITEGGRRLKRGTFSVQKSLFHDTIRLVLPSGTYCFAVKE